MDAEDLPEPGLLTEEGIAELLCSGLHITQKITKSPINELKNIYSKILK